MTRWQGFLVAVALCGAALFPPGAQALPVSISTGSGAMLGGAKELVYDSGYTVSELDWPLLPAFYAEVTLNLGKTAGFLSSLDLQVGIPGLAGSMTDSDFLNGDGVKTHFSLSEGDVESAILLTAQAGWGFPFDLPRGRVWTLEPFLSFEFIRLEWTAQNGYLQYPPETSAPFTPWSPSTPKIPITGTGIIYTQNYLIPAFGLKGAFPLSEALTATVSFTLSPYLWCWDKDSHLFRQLDFYDTLQGGLLLEPRLSATYRFSSRTAVSLDVLYRHITNLIGDEYAVATGVSAGQQSSIFTNGAGASLDVVNVTASVELSF